MSWIAQLPAGILYSAMVIIGIAVIGGIWVLSLTILRGGKIKFGNAEIDAPEAEHPQEVAK